MSFTAPLWLAIAVAGAVAVVIAHLFSASVPQRDLFPTARFIPQQAPLAVLRTRRLSDLLLLVLRVVACLLLGLALAGAHIARRAPERVLVVDASRAVASVAELRDSARAYQGSVLVVFDSAARRAPADTLGTLALSGARGSLSAALAAAQRAMQGFDDGRAATELVVVSPLVREEFDSATAVLLAGWEGPVNLVRVRASAAPALRAITVRAEGDDPVAAAFALRPARVGQNVRVVRSRATARDTAWARDSAGVLVLWPVAGDGLQVAARADTATAVAGGDAVVVSSFARAHGPRAGRVVARWNDGAPAATETPLGSGCAREVAIPVDAVGDVSLRQSFRGLAAWLAQPCGGPRHFEPADIAAPHRPGAASTPQTPMGREPVWLALLALAALIAEQIVRSRVRATA